MKSQKKVNGGSQYIEISIANTKQTSMLASYNANLSEPIIDKSIGYDIGVVRMKYPNNSIPLSERFLDTEYSVSLSLGFNVGFTSFLLNSDIQNGSQFIWSYSEYITAYNAALNRAYLQMRAVYDPLLYYFYGPPYITLDSNTKLMTLHNYAYRDGPTLTYKLMYIFTNTNCGNKFPFPSIFVNPTNPLDKVHVPAALVGCNINDVLYSLVSNGAADEALKNSTTTQDSASLALLSSLDAVVINCGFCITQELNLSNINSVSSQNLQLSNTLTDLEITYSPLGRDLNGYDFFYSSGFVRRYAFNNDAPLTRISVQLFWKSNTGGIYPLYLSLNTNVSMKLELREITNMTVVATN
jgi:hypothetical protein